METAPEHVLQLVPSCLETFLVEWKPIQRVSTKPRKSHLETFLVEWKPGVYRRIVRILWNLETFLVEWKRRSRQSPQTGRSALKPS